MFRDKYQSDQILNSIEVETDYKIISCVGVRRPQGIPLAIFKK
jgi:hypothetical protein